MRSSSVVDVLLTRQMVKTRKQIRALLPSQSEPTFVGDVFKAITNDLLAGASQEKGMVLSVIQEHSPQIAELVQAHSAIMKKASTATSAETAVAIDLWCDNVITLASDMMRAKFGKLISARLDAGLVDRVFNGFPGLLEENELQGLISEFMAIAENAIPKGKMSEDALPELSEKNKRLMDKWFDKVAAIACDKLFDLEGEPTIQLMTFLRLDETRQTILKANAYAMIVPFLENVSSHSLEVMASKKDYSERPEAYTGVLRYLSGKTTFNDAYFRAKHAQYTECVTKLAEDALQFKATMVLKKGDIDAKLTKNPSPQESEKLTKQGKAIEKMLKIVDRFLHKVTNTQEFAAELKKAGSAFETKPSLFSAFGKKDPIYTSILQFVKREGDLVNGFYSGAGPAPREKLELKK